MDAMTASVSRQTPGWECGRVLRLERLGGGGLRYTTVRLLPFVSLDGWACRVPGGLATSRHDQLGMVVAREAGIEASGRARG